MTDNNVPTISEEGRGRPTVYNKDTAQEICARLAQGQSLRSICRDEGMPPESTVREWVHDDRAGFAAHYAQAREFGWDAMAEEIIEISDDGRNDWMERNGKDDKGWQVNGEHIQRSKLRTDTRRWILSKLCAKRYGDRLTLTDGDDKPVGTPNMKALALTIAFALESAEESDT